MKIGYIGLGKMGKNMVLRLLEEGIEVVAWNRSQQPLDEVVEKGAIKADSVEDLVNKLKSKSSHPRLDRGSIDSRFRGNDKGGGNDIEKGNDNKSKSESDGVIIWLMLPAGNLVDEFIEKLSKLLSPGDLVIDGGNSYYKDSIRRSEFLSRSDISFMDVGTSGGPKGARSGACLMVGGAKVDFEKAEDLLKAAAAPGAYAHLGSVGAGHFAKMVHNGIEYGMMEAIAEGASILRAGPFKYDLAKLFDLYNHSSVIESRLVEWAKEAFNDDPNLANISSEIKSTGEGKWTLETAKEFKIDTPVLEASLKVRETSKEISEDSPEGFRNKVVSALRGKFGGHEVKKENG